MFEPWDTVHGDVCLLSDSVSPEVHKCKKNVPDNDPHSHGNCCIQTRNICRSILLEEDIATHYTTHGATQTTTAAMIDRLADPDALVYARDSCAGTLH